MSTSIILTILTGHETGQTIVLRDQPLYTIGRSRSCTLRLPEDPTVSRQHCLLEVTGPNVKVRDLGSKNGTRVNGTLIGQRDFRPDDDTLVEMIPCSLQSGDRLGIGQALFDVDILESESPPASSDEMRGFEQPEASVA
jgi:pSer/pThr/pTyr-binding forkhead associated (FHA) protein